MTNRSIVRSRFNTPRRKRQWAQTIANFSIVGATHATQVAINLLAGLETALGMQLNNVTISALNFNVTYRMTQATTGDDSTISTGIVIVGLDAFPAGGVALPFVTEDHADWMFWDTRTLVASRDVTDKDEMNTNGFLQIRNKSMRKMRENNQTLALISGADLLQQTTCQVFVGGRALILL